MTVELPIDIEEIKGFLAPAEGEALYSHALTVAAFAPVLEVGSYCGKSTVYLGVACRERGGVLYALDHHQGSEEHQPGEGFHDPELYAPETGRMDSFREFRRTIRAAGLEDTVVPIVAPSALAARFWSIPLGMVFIDGGHSMDAAFTDYRCWAGHIVAGGLLAVHDLFENPEKGGQAPITIYRKALASGLFEELDRVGTLGVLKRL